MLQLGIPQSEALSHLVGCWPPAVAVQRFAVWMRVQLVHALIGRTSMDYISVSAATHVIDMHGRIDSPPMRQRL